MDLDQLIQRRFKMRGAVTPVSHLPVTSSHGGRERLIEVFNEVGFTEGVEVGTASGKFAAHICRTMPKVHLTCVDPYSSYIYITQEAQDRAFAEAQQRTAGLNVTFLKLPSLDAVKQIPDASVDFVYIDGDHSFDAVMCDIIHWTPKVKTGGVLAGHDFFWYPSVFRAVQAYTDNHNIVNPWYAVLERVGGTYWWVVKR